MKKLLLTLITVFTMLLTHAQDQTPERKGFTAGAFVGVGVIHFTSGLETSETQGNILLPNVKLGWFVKDNLALYLNTPGQVYEKGDLDRSLEGIIPSIQYWASDRLWVSGGFGPSLDTRAVYESKSKSEKSNWGKGLLLSSGYELIQRKKWAMDLQAVLFMASVKLDEGVRREGTSFSVGVGFTLF